VSKHGPNRLLAYIEIHETVLSKLRRGGFVESDNLELLPLPGDVLRMEGEVRCAGGLVITVDKYLRIIDGAGTAAPPSRPTPTRTTSVSLDAATSSGTTTPTTTPGTATDTTDTSTITVLAPPWR
jgi:hypothetical protein